MEKYSLKLNNSGVLSLIKEDKAPITDLAKIIEFFTKYAKLEKCKEVEKNAEGVTYRAGNVDIFVEKIALDFFERYYKASRILNVIALTTKKINPDEISDDEEDMIDEITANLKDAMELKDLATIEQDTKILEEKNKQLVTKYNIKITPNKDKSKSGIALSIGAICLGVIVFGSALGIMGNLGKDNLKSDVTSTPYVTVAPTNTPVITPSPTSNIISEVTPNVTDDPNNYGTVPPRYYDNSAYENPDNSNAYNNQDVYVSPTPYPYDPTTNTNPEPTPEVTPIIIPTPEEPSEPTPNPIEENIVKDTSYISVPGLEDMTWDDKYQFVNNNYNDAINECASITGVSSDILKGIAANKGYHDSSDNKGIMNVNLDGSSHTYYNFNRNQVETLVMGSTALEEKTNILAGAVRFNECLSSLNGNLVAALYAYDVGVDYTKNVISSLAQNYGMSLNEFLQNTPDYNWIDAFNKETYKEDGSIIYSNYVLDVLSHVPANSLLVTKTYNNKTVTAYSYSVSAQMIKNDDNFVFSN